MLTLLFRLNHIFRGCTSFSILRINAQLFQMRVITKIIIRTTLCKRFSLIKSRANIENEFSIFPLKNIIVSFASFLTL